MQRSRQRRIPIHIRHALTGGEYHVPGINYQCDGFVENLLGKGTTYEFYGGRFYSLTKFGIEFATPIPLDPRESFFGSRTNATKLHYKAEEDESIQH